MDASRTLQQMALDQLMIAFAKADPDVSGGSAASVEWEDLELALQLAMDANPGRYAAICKELEKARAET